MISFLRPPDADQDVCAPPTNLVRANKLFYSFAAIDRSFWSLRLITGLQVCESDCRWSPSCGWSPIADSGRAASFFQTSERNCYTTGSQLSLDVERLLFAVFLSRITVIGNWCMGRFDRAAAVFCSLTLMSVSRVLVNLLQCFHYLSAKNGRDVY